MSFSKRAEKCFQQWKRSGTPEDLALVLREVEPSLASAVHKRFRGSQWSVAQTFSDAYQELQRKVLAGGWRPADFPHLANLARAASVILANHVVDRLRRQAVIRFEDLDDALALYATNTRQPEVDCRQRETARIVRWMIESLESDWAEVLRMKYLEGYTNAAIARVLDRTEDAVRMLLRRAMRALEGRLLTQGTEGLEP